MSSSSWFTRSERSTLDDICSHLSSPGRNFVVRAIRIVTGCGILTEALDELPNTLAPLRPFLNLLQRLISGRLTEIDYQLTKSAFLDLFELLFSFAKKLLLDFTSWVVDRAVQAPFKLLSWFRREFFQLVAPVPQAVDHGLTLGGLVVAANACLDANSMLPLVQLVAVPAVSAITALVITTRLSHIILAGILHNQFANQPLLPRFRFSMTWFPVHRVHHLHPTSNTEQSTVFLRLCLVPPRLEMTCGTTMTSYSLLPIPRDSYGWKTLLRTITRTATVIWHSFLTVIASLLPPVSDSTRLSLMSSVTFVWFTQLLASLSYFCQWLKMRLAAGTLIRLILPSTSQAIWITLSPLVVCTLATFLLIQVLDHQ